MQNLTTVQWVKFQWCVYQWKNTRTNVLIQFSRSVMSDSLRPHEPQHARPPCPSPTLGVYPNPCPLSRWCHPTISSSVIPFSSCSQSFPASESFQMSQLFVTGGQSIGVSASTSVLPMNTQGIKEYAGPDREKRNILKKRSKIRQWQELGEESWEKTLKVFNWLRGLEHIQ